jgi:hypothetical protein
VLFSTAKPAAVETSVALSVTLHHPMTHHPAHHACRLPSAKPFVLAQRYVANPLLINGCKFGIRLWLLVTGVDPFTCYLHKQGLVLFSTDRCGQATVALPLQQLVLCCTSTIPAVQLLLVPMFSMEKSGRLWGLSRQHNLRWNCCWCCI